ncbi:MAG: hypothetical protein CSA86_05045 [Arcobacter sp.]|nr:MAG: hypothetical protein CSA86_05045 [Arcobacter sp.]
MKKMIKMSLVAAVAVAGLSSTASAVSLEESIKGVDISGMVRYRFTDSKTEDVAGSGAQENDYDIEVTAKVPVNDMVKAVVKVDVDGDLRADKNYSEDDHGNMVAGEPADAKPSVNIQHAYFQYENDGIVLNAGKQALPGPLTDGLNGTAVVAMAPVGPVTVAGAIMNASALDDAAGYEDIYAVAAMGSFSGVDAQLWYADVADTASAFSVGVEGEAGPAAFFVSYAKKDTEDKSDDDKYSTFKVGGEFAVDMFTVNAGYAMTGEEGSGELSDGNDAAVNDFGGEIYDIAQADYKLIALGAGMSPADNVDAGLELYMGTYENDDKTTEVVARVAYKMSKNFKISSYYAHAKLDYDAGGDQKDNKGRVEVKYSF